MRRPTRFAAVLFSASVPLALALVFIWPEYWYAAFYYPVAVLAVLAVDMALLLPAARLHCVVQTRPRLFVGEQGGIEIALETVGAVSPAVVSALAELSGPAAEPQERSAALTEGKAVLTLPFRPERRGTTVVEAVWLRWRSPFGLAEIRQRRAVGQAVEIVPNIRGISEEALSFTARDAVFGQKSQLLLGEGAEFDRLGEFAEGMDSRFIDWKRSARHRKLLSKQFRQERNHQIILGFDTGRLMLDLVGGVAKLDHAVRAGLTLGWASLREGDLVGGCAFDQVFRSFIQPGRGMPYFSKLQRFAAGLDCHAQETNFTLGLSQLAARLKRRALVVMFSDFADSIAAELLVENLQHLLKRHLVVFVAMRDPLLTRLRDAQPAGFAAAAEAVIADAFLRDRSVVLERLARLGVHCLDVPPERLPGTLLNRYLLIKQRGLL